MTGPSAAYRPFGAFRFGLAMMVVVQHGLLLLPAAGRDALYALELGAVAVAVFFALSGFIVAEATARFYAHRPAAFLANRALRIVPPYLAALALTVGADSLLYAAGHLQALDAPLSGPPWRLRVVLAAILEIVPGLPAHRIGGQDFSFIPFAWTLRVEFAFYLVAFATSWLMARGTSGSWRRRVGAAAFAAGYLAFGLFLYRHWRFGAAGGGLQFLNVPFFAFGVCAYLLQAERSPRARWHCLATACLVPVAFVLCGERGHPVFAFQLPLLGLLFTALVALSRLRLSSPFLLAWDKRLGALSYPLYIGHGVVLTVLSSVSTRRGVLPLVLAAVVSLGLAVGLHEALERPLRQIRTRLRGAVV